MATAQASRRAVSSSRTQDFDLATPVTACVLVHLLLMAAYVAAFHGEISALVCVDQARVGQFPFEQVAVGFGKGGYDGQFYYALARDPWHAAPAGTIDLPAYRHGRILFPVLAWLLSGRGEPTALLWALPAINLCCIGVLAWLGAVVASSFGRSPWWGFWLPVVLNVGLSALRDLTDPLGATAVCGLLAAQLLGWRSLWLGLWAAAAVLSREQNLLIVGIVLLGCLAERRWERVTALGVAVAVWVAWVGVLFSFYHALPMSPDNLAAPFAGFTWRWNHPNGQGETGRLPIHALSMVLLAVQFALCILLALMRAERLAFWTALAGATLAIFAGQAVFEGAHSYARVLLWMPLGIWLWSVQTGRRWPVVLLSPAALWPLFAVVQVWRM